MTIPKKALELAIAGGYHATDYGRKLKDYGMKIEMENKGSSTILIFGVDNKGTTTYDFVTEEQLILDPLFWQALGKELVWEKVKNPERRHRTFLE